MAGTAAQKAPEKKTKTYEARPKNQTQEKSGLKEKLHRLPPAAGAALMCLLLALALPVGNFRALQRATPGPFMRQGDVGSIVEDRAAAAKNVLTVARRTGLDEEDVKAVEMALALMQEAGTAREISRADQQLEAAVSRLTTAALSGEEARNMLRAADDFAEQGSFLRQEARAFNKKALKAETLYEKLPLRALFGQPDVYEGI